MAQGTPPGRGQHKRVADVKVFAVHSPTAEDIERAKLLRPAECPRRYCWWWHSLSFDWSLDVGRGCQWQERAKALEFATADTPCCREDPSSNLDHYERRTPHLLEDGFDIWRWSPNWRDNLDRIGPKSVPILVEALCAASPKIKEASLRSLARMGNVAKVAIPIVRALLTGPDPNLRQIAAETLKEIQPEDWGRI